MAVVARMAQTSTSQPNLWKPRYAAKAHQEKPQPAQQFTRSRSLREPFDAAELTRKLEIMVAWLHNIFLEKTTREILSFALSMRHEHLDHKTRRPAAQEREIVIHPTSHPGVFSLRLARKAPPQTPFFCWARLHCMHICFPPHFFCGSDRVFCP